MSNKIVILGDNLESFKPDELEVTLVGQDSITTVNGADITNGGGSVSLARIEIPPAVHGLPPNDLVGVHLSTNRGQTGRPVSKPLGAVGDIVRLGGNYDNSIPLDIKGVLYLETEEEKIYLGTVGDAKEDHYGSGVLLARSPQGDVVIGYVGEPSLELIQAFEHFPVVGDNEDLSAWGTEVFLARSPQGATSASEITPLYLARDPESFASLGILGQDVNMITEDGKIFLGTVGGDIALGTVGGDIALGVKDYGFTRMAGSDEDLSELSGGLFLARNGSVGGPPYSGMEKDRLFLTENDELFLGTVGGDIALGTIGGDIALGTIGGDIAISEIPIEAYLYVKTKAETRYLARTANITVDFLDNNIEGIVLARDLLDKKGGNLYLARTKDSAEDPKEDLFLVTLGKAISMTLENGNVYLNSMGIFSKEDLIALREDPADGGEPEVDVGDGINWPTPTDGDGTELYPYRINNSEQFSYIGENFLLWDKHFIMTSDIDLSAHPNIRIGNSGSSAFTGSFDGQGYTIDNYTYNDEDASYVGLFGHTSNATIRGMRLFGASVTGRFLVGGLIGFASNTVIESCSVSGTITATEGHVGGLVGSAVNSSVHLCFTNTVVTASDTFTSGNDLNAGGLVGLAQNTSLTSCYSLNTVSGNTFVGGVAGRVTGMGSVLESFAFGAVTGTGEFIGPLVSVPSISLAFSYYNAGNDLTTHDNTLGSGLTEFEFSSQDTQVFQGFDFVDDWKMTGAGLPKLIWED